LWLLSICFASSSRHGGPKATEHDLAETEMGLSFPEFSPAFFLDLFFARLEGKLAYALGELRYTASPPILRIEFIIHKVLDYRVAGSQGN